MMLATGRDKGRRANSGQRNAAAAGAAQRYEVLNRAGEGTLWIVYRVRERDGSGDLLALKALKGAFNRHTPFAEALLRATRAVLPLNHPHVAELREVGSEEGTLFVATEWLPDGDLESVLATGPLGAEQAAEILRDVARGLTGLHEKKICHGDVRPRQIRASADGVWKLTDTGLAAALAAAGMAMADVQPEASLYLAPERTQGASVSATTDMYSAGVILYRMLTARPPFDGPSPLAIALRHRNDTPLAPQQLNPRCALELSDLAMALLEKDAKLRPTAPELEAALDQFLAEPSRLPAPARAHSAPVPAAPEEDDVPVPSGRGRRARQVAHPARIQPAGPPQPLTPAEIKTLKRKHTWREFWGALGALVGLLFAFCGLLGVFGAAYYKWVSESPPEVRVPAYRLMLQENAQELLADAGLTMRIGKEVYDPKQPAGTIMSGDPPPGKLVRANREVVVTISQGQKPFSMPDFGEMSLQQARKIVNLTGMKVGTVSEQYHDKVPKGYICGQYPSPGDAVKRSDPITLIISRGPQPTDLDPSLDPLGTGSGESANNSPNADQADITPAAGDETSNADLNSPVTRAVRIRVAVPSDGPSQRVQILVIDSSGERTVYSRQRKPGEIVSEKVKITREQGTTATIRVYVGDQLIKEQTV